MLTSVNHNRAKRRRSSAKKSEKKTPKKGTHETTTTGGDDDDSDHEGELYCVCQQEYDPALFYICCDICEKWYHGVCLKITPQEVILFIATPTLFVVFFPCPICDVM
jgi:COMPASS component SPP1